MFLYILLQVVSSSDQNRVSLDKFDQDGNGRISFHEFQDFGEAVGTKADREAREHVPDSPQASLVSVTSGCSPCWAQQRSQCEGAASTCNCSWTAGFGCQVNGTAASSSECHACILYNQAACTTNAATCSCKWAAPVCAPIATSASQCPSNCHIYHDKEVCKAHDSL